MLSIASRPSLVAVSLLALCSLPACKDDPAPTAEPAPPPASAEQPKPAFGNPKHRPRSHIAYPGSRMAMRFGDADGGASAADGGSAGPAASANGGTAPASRKWSFDADKVDAAPTGFELVAIGGKAGSWLVKGDTTAPSGPNVLSQLDGDKGAGRSVAALLNEPTMGDGRVSVRCKLVSGKADEACGIVFRWKDAKSHYVARADAIQKDLGFYAVKDGKATPLGAVKLASFPEGWHELRIDTKADHFELSWDGTRLVSADDKSYPDAGRVGVWTKGDSIAEFDDLSVTPL